MSYQIELPKVDDLKKEIYPVWQQSENMIIRDDSDFSEAGEALKSIAAWRKKLTAIFEAPKDAANKAHKAICAAHKTIEEPLLIAENLLRSKTSKYIQYKEEEARREREEALRIAREEEKKRREEEAEKLRIEAEAAREAGQYEEAAQAQAMAQTVQEAPIIVSAPVVLKSPKIDGVSFVDKWEYRVINESLIPRMYLMLNDKAIGAAVKSLKANAKIEGIEVFCTKSTKVSA